jgi:Zn-dependent peptidase ImmA (M78 family)/transcriptional regulator with XRE-family HTH domain
MRNAIKSWVDLGARVARARVAARLSQADLAAAIELERTAVTKIESGSRHVDSLELARLARVLGRPLDWFVVDPPPSVVSRRARVDPVPESPADLLLEGAVRDVSLLVELHLLVPAPGFHPTAPVDSVAAAAVAALELREHLGLGMGPVWELSRIVESVGLHGFSLDLGTEQLDGAYLALEQGGVALVNGGTPSGRRRFTLAHELGHHVLADQYSDEWIIGSGADDRERLINAFAIHFLMPGPGTLPRWNILQGPTDARGAALHLGVEYGVSWAAAVGQLRNLGLVDEATHRELERARPTRADYLEHGLTLREDLAAPTLPPRVAAAALKGYRSHKLGAARVLEILRGTLAEGELPPDDQVPLAAMRAELELE